MKVKTVYESENGKEFQNEHEAVLEDLRHILVNTSGHIMPRTKNGTVPINHLIASLEWLFTYNGKAFNPYIDLLLKKKNTNSPTKPPKSK